MVSDPIGALALTKACDVELSCPSLVTKPRTLPTVSRDKVSGGIRAWANFLPKVRQQMAFLMAYEWSQSQVKAGECSGDHHLDDAADAEARLNQRFF